MSFEDFFSEFYYPDEIVMENEGNVQGSSFYFSRFAYLNPYNKQLNNLVCLGSTVNIQTSCCNFCFMDLAQRLRPQSKNFIPQSGILQ